MSQKNPVLLIVDDRPDNLFVIEQLISSFIPECITHTASNADTAMEKALKIQPDGILSDIQMPGKSGIELCRLLKSTPGTSQIPVLLITAHKSDVNLRIRGLEAGADDFISRPIDNQELIARLKVMLRIKKMQDELIEAKAELENKVNDRTFELKKANENLRQVIKENERAKDKILESDNFNKILLKTIPFPMDIVDEDGNVLFLNERLLKIFGEDFLGKKCWDLYRDDRSQCTNCPLKSGIQIGVTKNLECQKVMGEKIFQIFHTGMDFFGKKALLEIFIDITERKQIEDEKKKLELQLKQTQKLDAVGQLAGGVAHDFNNVLNGVMSAAQLLQQPRRNLDKKSLEYVEMILKASYRAAELVDRLLTFGRKSEMTLKAVNIHEILNDSISILKRTIDRKIEINMLAESRKTDVLGNHSALENIFLNLGINASHAMEEGGELLIKTEDSYLDQYHCDASPFNLRVGNYCKISIIDSGKGMPDDILDKIFEPFFTTKKQGEGTGLGLAAVYGIIKEHNAEINVSSVIDMGTTFTIYLPCAEEIEKDSYEETTISKGYGSILLVDDEEINRIVNKEILESLGYNVIVAEDGRESLMIFRENHKEIDIVIMDMIMPNMNGSEAFFQMKEIDEQCKVIISSGYTKNENMDMLLRNGLAGFIQKPYKIDEISRLLNKIISH